MSAAPLVGHQAQVEWMGSRVLTLADLVPEHPRAVIVGINPAPTSVAAGHYYQGRLGQLLFRRLRQAGVLRPATSGWDDDEAVIAGFGFTDIVKRPTPRAADVRPEEYAFGLERLVALLTDADARLVIFTFKKTAEVVLGRFHGTGLLDARVGSSPVFVMPGPYAPRQDVEQGLRALAGALAA